MVEEFCGDRISSDKAEPDGNQNEAASLFERVMEEKAPSAISNKIDQRMDTLTKSLPLREGESYEQVLERMFPKMKESDLQTLLHDVEELNKDQDLKAGEQFEILGEYGKKLLKESILKEHEHDYVRHSESRLRSRFSPAYVEAMKYFKQEFSKSSQQSAQLPEIGINFDS